MNRFRRRIEKKHGFPVAESKRASDWTTRTIAILALIVSAAGFYYGNLRVVDDFHWRPVSWNIKQNHETSDYDELLLRLAFVNLGNRRATLTGVSVIIDPRASDVSITAGERGVESVRIHGTEAVLKEQLPFIVEPSSIRIVELTVPAVAFAKRLGPPRHDAPTRTIEFSLLLDAVDSRGAFHVAKDIAGELKFRGTSYEVHTMYAGPFEIL